MKNLIRYYTKKIFSKKSTYILTALFTVFCPLYFYLSTGFFSEELSTDLHLFFLTVASLCIIYIPAVSATLDFTYEEQSFPYGIFKIICAKFIACMCVFFTALFIFSLVPLTVSRFGNIDVSALLCEYLGIILYAALCVSFCIFIFSMVQKKAFAFALCTAVLAATNTVHLIPMYTGMQTNLGFLNFISTVWHFDGFSKGLLNSKDIAFFIILSALFLFLTFFTIEKKRGLCDRLFFKISSAAFFAFVLLLLDTNFFYFKIDVTSSKKFSVSDLSKSYLLNLDDTLEVTYYRSRALVRRFPKIRDIEDYLKEYCSYGLSVSFSVIDPTDDSEKEKLELYGISSQSISSSDSNSQMVTRVYSAITITYHGQTEVIPFIVGTENLEYDLALRLDYLASRRKRIVQIVSGSSYDLQTDFAHVIPFLEYNGFTPVQTMLPSQSKYSQQESSFDNYINVPLVVLGSSAFTDEDSKSLENFMLNGGRAFIASEPYSVNLEDDWSITQGNGKFERMLFTFGVYYDMEPLCDLSNFTLSLYSDATEQGHYANARDEYVNYPLWPVLLSQSHAQKGMTLFWPASITCDSDVAQIEGFDVKPYLVTSRYAWNLENSESGFVTNPFFVPKSFEDPSKASQKIVAAQVLKNGECTAIVFANSLAFHSSMLAYSSERILDTRSLDFLNDSLLILCGYEDFAALKNKSYFNHSLSKELKKTVQEYANFVYFLSIIFAVGINLTLGFAVSLFQRRLFNEIKR